LVRGKKGHSGREPFQDRIALKPELERKTSTPRDQMQNGGRRRANSIPFPHKGGGPNGTVLPKEEEQEK